MNPTALAHIPRAAYLVAMLAGAAGVLAWRVHETTRPVTTARIVAPPLGMATGFSMFAAPATRVPWTWGLGAFAVGAVLLYLPLARTSALVRQGDVVLMRRSRAFLAILLALVAVRLLLHQWVEHLLTPMQTAAIFFILAFGMILRWRATMLLSYLRLRGQGGGQPA